jgi:hypothetical protein
MLMKLRLVPLALLTLFLIAGFGIQCGKGPGGLAGTWSKTTGALGPTSMTLNKDGTGTFVFPPWGSNPLKWAVEGEELVITPQNGKASRAKFELKGSTLTLHHPEGVIAYKRGGA